MPKSVTSYFPAFLVMGSFRKSGTPDIDPVTYQIPEVRHAQYPRSKDIFPNRKPVQQSERAMARQFWITCVEAELGGVKRYVHSGAYCANDDQVNECITRRKKLVSLSLYCLSL